MARLRIASPAHEPEKWLALALAAVAVGLLPKRWEKGLAAAAAIVYFLR